MQALLLKGEWMEKTLACALETYAERSYTLFYKWHSRFAWVCNHWFTIQLLNDRLYPQHCNQSSTSWDPHKMFQAYDSELLSDGNRGGAFGYIFLLKLLHCHIFGWEELKKLRDVLSYLKVLPAFAVSSWVYSPLAVTDRCYSPSFIAHYYFFIF